MSAYLVLRRAGATWALPHPAVRGLSRHAGDGGGFLVRLADGALAADELIGVAAELRCHPAGAVLRRFWPEAARGLAVHGGLPLVLIDPAAPPAALRPSAAAEEPGPGAGGAGRARGREEDSADG